LLSERVSDFDLAAPHLHSIESCGALAQFWFAIFCIGQNERISDPLRSANLIHAHAAVKSNTDCRCHFCDETLQPEILFCNDDCRDDYEKEEAARARNGR